MPKGVKGFQPGNKEAKKKGKHKKTLEKEMILEYMRGRIIEEFEELMNRQIELAKGIYIMKPIKQGGKIVDVKIYKQKPDQKSLEYLFNVVVGRPTQPIDITSKGEKITGWDIIKPKEVKEDENKGKTNA